MVPGKFQLLYTNSAFVLWTIYLSLIKTDFLEELKSKSVKFWKDLEWQDWHLNKVTGSECLQSRVFEYECEYRFSTYIEAESKLIELQI